MPGFVKTYVPDRLLVIWGPFILDGWMKGTFLKIEQDGAQVVSTQGPDGFVGRAVKAHSPLTKFTASLMQTSETNAALAGAADVDRLTGQGIHPLTVKDLSGTTMYFCPQAWIAERPKPDFGQEVTGRDWVLEGLCEQEEGFNF